MIFVTAVKFIDLTQCLYITRLYLLRNVKSKTFTSVSKTKSQLCNKHLPKALYQTLQTTRMKYEKLFANKF